MSNCITLLDKSCGSFLDSLTTTPIWCRNCPSTQLSQLGTCNSFASSDLLKLWMTALNDSIKDMTEFLNYADGRNRAVMIAQHHRQLNDFSYITMEQFNGTDIDDFISDLIKLGFWNCMLLLFYIAQLISFVVLIHHLRLIFHKILFLTNANM